MNKPHKFIGLEDEIMLRRAIRAVYENEGMIGIYQCMGELAKSLEIVGQMVQEILDDQVKKKQGPMDHS